MSKYLNVKCKNGVFLVVRVWMQAYHDNVMKTVSFPQKSLTCWHDMKSQQFEWVQLRKMCLSLFTCCVEKLPISKKNPKLVRWLSATLFLPFWLFQTVVLASLIAFLRDVVFSNSSFPVVKKFIFGEQLFGKHVPYTYL